MPTDGDVLIEVRHLAKSFGDHEVLKDISLEVHKGEVISIIGPSGCGKSTFLRSLNLLERPTSGTILFEGTDITAPVNDGLIHKLRSMRKPKDGSEDGNEQEVDIDLVRRRIGMVFQSFNLFPHKTVKENIMLAPVKLKIMTEEEASAKADELRILHVFCKSPDWRALCILYSFGVFGHFLLLSLRFSFLYLLFRPSEGPSSRLHWLHPYQDGQQQVAQQGQTAAPCRVHPQTQDCDPAFVCGL